MQQSEPKRRGRPPKAKSNALVPLSVIVERMQESLAPEVERLILPDMPAIPDGWLKGALLNARASGEGYIVSLFPAEYDWQHPEKSMIFTHTGMAQDFISRWYSPEAGARPW